MYSGIVIHNWGAAVENVRPPYVSDFMAGVHNSERDDDRSALDGYYFLIRGSRYQAGCPFKILYVIRRILKLTLASTGSLSNIGVTWSELRASVTFELQYSEFFVTYLFGILGCHIRDYCNSRVWKSQGS